MSNKKKLHAELSKAASHVAEATKKAARAAGDGLYRVQQKEIDQQVGSRSEQVLEEWGAKLEKGAPGLEVKINAALDARTDKPGKFIATGIGRLGQAVRKYASLAGSTAGGVTGGLLNASSGVCDLSITKSDLAEIEQRCLTAAQKAERITSEQNANIGKAVERRDKEALLDVLTVGGVTLAAAMQVSEEIPAEIEHAYTLAYPRMAEGGTSFSDAIAERSPEELVGLVSGVKGKLFEIQLVDQLNQGQLEEGLHATLAASPTQEGYDIQILDERGLVAEELQAKATESVAYVREALERYPSVDVVTTSEVYGDLLSSGSAAGILDGGINEAELHSQVETAAGGVANFGLEDFAPSALGLALIAFSSFRKNDIPLETRGAEFGERGARAAVASSLGAGAILATGVGAIGVIAGIGSHSASTIGAQRRRRYEALKSISERLEASNQRNASRLKRARARMSNSAFGHQG